MPGKRITQQQVKLYMTYRKEGLTQEAAAAKTDISTRTGRTIEKSNQAPSTKGRHWRTRKDPFESVWDQDIVPFLKEYPEVSPLTLLEYLQEQYPKQYPDKLLRTLQRRVKKFRALQGADKSVMFDQHYPPGIQCLSDFTLLKNQSITIQQQPLNHLLYHFRLRYSGWSHMKVILGGESFSALTEGMQEAFWRLGGVPQEHRTDSLSAAYKNREESTEQDLTRQYESFCKHYNIKPTRNNLGQSHENGAVESGHGHLKRRIEQGILLRGNADFESVSAYQQFIDKIVYQHNRRNAQSIEVERPYLQDLPETKTIDFSELSVKVSNASIIRVRSNAYSVPSRLIGECLRVHLYHDRLECYLSSSHVATLKRVYSNKSSRNHNIDYRHVYESLKKKPNAFRHWVFKDDVLPTDIYRQIWRAADRLLEPQLACKYIVGCLALAAEYKCERMLGDFIVEALVSDTLPSLSDLQLKFGRKTPTLPTMNVHQHDLASYDDLEVSHA